MSEQINLDKYLEILDTVAAKLDKLEREHDRLQRLIAETMTPEQEFRAQAIDTAARIVAPTMHGRSLIGLENDRELITDLWLHLAELGATYIRDGRRRQG
jgi:hypothetical protein